MKFNHKEITGAIFDLDSTLLDSHDVWSRIDRDFLGKRGFPVPDDYVDQITPMGFGEAADYTIQRFSLQETKEEVMAEWNRMAHDAYAYDVQLRAGVKGLLQRMQEEGVRMAVATSNTEELFVPCLERNGIAHYFEAFTEVKEVLRGKGFPDIYLRSAEKIGCRPEQCVVFEDLIPAVKAAGSAKFYTVGVCEPAWGYPESEMRAVSDCYIHEIYEALALINT